MRTKCRLLGLGLAAGLALVIGRGAAAQQSVSVAPLEGLTVHGHGEVVVKPDIAHALVSIRTQQQDQTQAVTENSTLVHTVLAALKGSMIPDKDVETEYYGVDPQYDYHASPPTFTGYQVMTTLRLTLRDIGKIGVILDKATRAGATSIDGLTFDLADRTQAEGEAEADAIANARVKADLMAGAAGMTLAHLVSVSDGEGQGHPIPMMMAAAGSNDEQSTEPTTVVPQMVTVTADAVLFYTIEPHR